MENKGHKPHSLEYLPVYLESSKVIVHYTCNAPSKLVLKKHNISEVGGEFGCAFDSEVLKIPLRVYNQAGLKELKDRNQLNLNLENLLRKLK